MESFTLTRKEMACLLLALDGKFDQKPLQVLQTAWSKAHRYDLEKGAGLPAFLSTLLPPIIEKLIKGNELKGFSLQEIAALGQLIEYSNLSITSMQNWVKRDFKPYFNCPKAGKKYSLNQAALLFIIDDLKSNLDFESIRKLFEIVFKKPEDDSDDLVGPIELYASYTSMFEELDENNDQLLDISGHPHQDLLAEHVIRSSANQFASRLPNLTDKQWEAVRNILLVAVISIQTSYFHSLSRRYCNATLFLNPQ
ncbi:DUF1836 domain-containing protein [Paenibacillus prosopidis]|uniref:Uncharacterized protein DUF1836 n=1 Tax=Paenibacillus prosopidis TaxID=630520 RepID=A0A368VX63_9BACL|nr:DUF1836 domain-containing protein [Paenibacillus prosopidis]RCW46500.1 uncharacterized protein DUF1836 [Paenibacillus prosopidis]